MKVSELLTETKRTRDDRQVKKDYIRWKRLVNMPIEDASKVLRN